MTEESGESEMLRELQRETAQLPREIQPPEEAWKKIKAQIDMEAQLVAMMPMQRHERAFWQRPAFLAAAALMLVAGASLMTALVIGRRMVAKTTSPIAATAPAEPASYGRSSICQTVPPTPTASTSRSALNVGETASATTPPPS